MNFQGFKGRISYHFLMFFRSRFQDPFLTVLGSILGSILGPKCAQKGIQKVRKSASKGPPWATLWPPKGAPQKTLKKHPKNKPFLTGEREARRDNEHVKKVPSKTHNCTKPFCAFHVVFGRACGATLATFLTKCA